MKALWDKWKSRRDLTLNEFLDDNNVWNKFQVETGEALTMEMLNKEILRRESNDAKKENRSVQQEIQQAPVETKQKNNANIQEQNSSSMFLPNVTSYKV